MGSLKPGVTYIYEHADGITYAREFGSSPGDRFEIGRDYKRHLKDELQLWEDIVRAGKTNQNLQEILERAKIVYYLIKKNNG